MSRWGWNWGWLALALLFVTACASKLPPSNSRWPHNRRLHDERLEKLEALQLEARILALEKRVRQLETREPPAPPAPPAAPTAP